MPIKPRYRSSGHAGLALGFRSGLEVKIASDLEARIGAPVDYEKHKIRYTVPAREATYTPDFVLPNGIIVETKGRFDADDRAKHLLIRKQHPDIDIRFLFSSAKTKLYAGSPTTYAAWCEKHDFEFAERRVPDHWIASNNRDHERWEAIRRAAAKG